MHLHSHYLDPAVCVATGLLAGSALAATVALPRRFARDAVGDSPTLPASARSPAVVAGAAALVFALQMLNFPVSSETSGHVLGGFAVALAFGPIVATWVITAVLLVQAVLFGDGGLAALGANVLNMAIVGVWSGWAVWRIVPVGNGKNYGVARILLAALAGWVSVQAAALACAVELATARQVALDQILATLLTVHAWIGVGEAILSAAVCAVVAVSKRADMQGGTSLSAAKGVGFIPGKSLAVILAVACLAVLIAPLASSLPDGLEWSAARFGWETSPLASGVGDALTSAMASWQWNDYHVPGWSESAGSTIAAGIVGLIVVLAMMGTIARLRGMQPVQIRKS